MYDLLLHTGLAHEVIVTEAKHYINRTNRRIEDWCDRYDEAHPVVGDCTGDLLCTRTMRRHKTGCIGKDVPFNQYVRGLS